MKRTSFIPTAAVLMAAAGAGTASNVKTPPKATAPAAAEPLVVGGFTIDTGFDIPEVTTGRAGKGPAVEYPFASLPLNASFLVPVLVPDTITNEDERAKEFKDLARKKSNSVTGAIKRFKAKNDGYDFTLRTVNDDTLGRGIRVWRTEPKPAEPEQAATA